MGDPGLVPRALHRTTFLPTDMSTETHRAVAHCEPLTAHSRVFTGGFKMNAMAARVTSEFKLIRRNTRRRELGIILVFIGAIILGHNTIYTSHPAILHVPVVNLFYGTAILISGVALYRRGQ